jgi:catechol 2,3-dioxygenase-like lactoylglutathione lyase family enzyme
MTIPARSIVTLGTHEYQRMRGFYTGLGWSAPEQAEDFCMFDMGGAWLGLFPFDKLAEDAHVAPGEPSTAYRGVALALNVESPELVDSTIEALRAAGATITKEPEAAVWGGRTAYWADPEGNLWEVAWNPFVGFDERGALMRQPAST